MKNQLKNLIKRREFVAFIGLAVICIAFCFGSSNFPTLYNAMNILRQASINAILAVGMTFVIISGGIDLSVGSTVSLSGTIAAIMMVNMGMNVFMGVIGGLLVGLIIGALNGIIISRLSVPPHHRDARPDDHRKRLGARVYRRAFRFRPCGRL